MPKPVKTILILLGVVSAIVVGLLLNPALIARPMLETALSDAGFRLLSLDGLSVGLSSAHANSLRADSNTLALNVENVSLSFDLIELLGGRISAIELESVALQLKEVTNEGSPADTSSSYLNPAQILETLAQLPVAEITVHAAQLSTAEGKLDTELSFQTSPLSLNAEGTWSGASQLGLSLSSTAPSENLLAMDLRLAEGDTALFQANAELSITQSASTVSGVIAFDAQALANEFLDDGLLSDWVLFNDQLQTDFRVVFATDNEGVQLESLNADLDAAGSTLQLARTNSEGQTLTQLSLPLSLNILPNTVNDSFRIQTSDLYGTLSLTEGDNELYFEASLMDVLANCDDFNHCRSQAEFQSQLLTFDVVGIQGQSLTAEGELEIETLPNLIEIETRDVTVSLDSAQFEDWRTSTQLSIERAFLILGEVDRAQLRFRSEQLSVASDDIHFTEPAVQGLMNYSDGSFAGSIDLTLGAGGDMQNPLLQSSFNHSLQQNRGNLKLEIADHLFSEQALSELLQQQLLPADISAGSISGGAEVNWSLGTDNQWAVNGPVTVSLNDISGNIEDTLIVGLNTTTTARIESWQTLISEQNLTATIDVVDTGLPLNNVQWLYAFNSAVPEITVSELNSDFFGGKVEIADFRFDPTQPEQKLTVVLSRLDLESIVGLAGYPEIFVDGLISGYIPLIIREGQILVEEGLVGALQPGGTIRYKPETAATDTVNSTVQLVNDALSNYQYETLDTRVYYDESGDLLMEVELRGINPDMNGGQPINLNVNVTDNIPSLLRSLQAGQAIQDRLEQQLQNR